MSGWRYFDDQFRETTWERNERLRKARLAKPKVCNECGQQPADSARGLCPGCEAYRDHTGQI